MDYTDDGRSRSSTHDTSAVVVSSKKPDFGVKTLAQLQQEPSGSSSSSSSSSTSGEAKTTPTTIKDREKQQQQQQAQIRASRDAAINAICSALASPPSAPKPEEDTSAELADPYLEAMRRSELRNLQSLLTHLCSREGLKHEPVLSFQRWYFVCKLLEKSPRDPLLPSGEVRIEQGLKCELMEAGLAEARAELVCVRLAEAAAEACANVSRYIRAAGAPCDDDDAAASRGLRRAEHPAPDLRVSSFGDSCQLSLRYPPNTRRECRLHLNWDKLERLRKEYKGPPESFESQLFCLLARYDALKGAGYQAALPDALFSLLSERLDVKHECFASPFNHFLPTYCSAFPDLDKWFGSSGSFFDMQPTTGSFEANPPFVEEVMAALAKKIEGWLTTSSQPLSFVVIVPGWTDTPAYTMFTQSAHLRCHLFFDKWRHAYKEGFQHTLRRQYKTAECQTFIFILQNTAGADEWPVTDALKEDIRTAFLPPTKS